MSVFVVKDVEKSVKKRRVRTTNLLICKSSMPIQAPVSVCALQACADAFLIA
jgi:hypothetical protein